MASKNRKSCLYGAYKGNNSDPESLPDNDWCCNNPSISIRTFYGSIVGECERCPEWRNRNLHDAAVLPGSGV